MENSQQENGSSIPSDLQCALDNFDEDSKKIFEPFLSELEKCPTPCIYHYTTDVGLWGILESGKLWLTDIFALNDPSEVQHGFDLATKILDEKAKNGPTETKIFSEDFKNALNNGKLRRIAHFFVCSFSKNGDDLGQWRSYSDNGRGYALCFDTAPIDAACTLASGRATFPVGYSDDELRNIHIRIIEKAYDLISLPRGKGLSGDNIVAYWSQLHTNLAKHVIHASLFFKHEAYKNEQEYRFLEVHSVHPQPDVKYRARHYSLIKYKEFDWKCAGLDVFKKIVIGPAADFEKSKRFAKDCLREAGIDLADDAITQSQIPYKPA